MQPARESRVIERVGSFGMGTKKAPSGFRIFTAEMRPKLREQQPSLSFGDMARKLGQLWKEMDESERAHYYDKAKAKKPFQKRKQ
jgi:high mobility group protein B3